tara:strand:- start:368 stop:2761 length:2394 start_codon:yes stop_codon:yes gene_type:complete
VSEKDQITPKLVHQFVRGHDKYARNNRKDWSLYKHTYMTRYWEYMTGDDMPKRNRRLREVEVEVNRLWGVITSYLSALYPRASRVVLSPDPTGKGDPEKAELAVNRMLSSRKIHERVMTSLRQALLYPGSGMKVGYKHGRGNPMDRVWMRVIPVWEMLLDTEVSDTDDERFRGHLYYRPKHEVEEEYGLKDLNGVRRVDFLSGSDTEADDYKNRKRYEVPNDDNNFVRVLEFCNLVDHYVDPENPEMRYEGRLEIYVMGQGAVSKKPVYVGPLPFAKHDGEPMAHIVPLIFNYEPEFPLRGIAHVKRLMPQFKELNAYRSYMAMATRKDTRQYVTRKGTFNSDEMTLLTEGHDGLILEVDSGYERPLADAILPIQNAPISANIQNYLATVEVDLERVIGTSPAARGIVTKATAYEVETVQQYTESEFGLHAAIKDQWLASLTELMMRALISCMQDDGDSAGAFEAQSVDVAEVGAAAQEDQPTEPEEREPETFDRAKIISLAEMIGVDVNEEDFKDLASKITMKRELDDMNEEELNLLGSTLAGRTADASKADEEHEEEQAELALVRNTASMQEPLVDDSVVPPLGLFEDGESYQIVSETIILRDRNEQIVVSAEDLDGNFLISFVEGGRTPMSDAAMQQNLVALLEPYSALWQTANQGGPVGVFAKNYMKVLAERFDLPKDLHPDELDAELAQQTESEGDKPAQQAQPAPQEAAPEQPPPEAGPEAPPPEGGAAPSPQEVIQQLAQMPPEQAIEALKQMFAESPEVMQVIQQIEAMPPDQQPAAIQQLLEAVSANI